MLSQRLFKLLSKIALLAIVFASLAPSISHALQANNSAGFAQEVCTTSGQKITIQVLTTKGQQLATELPAQTSEKQPSGIQHHLQHCPFCSAGSVAAVLPSNHSIIIAQLEASAQKTAEYAAPVVVSVPYATPPSQAPPSL
jgi:Protein of unknown function (DUF2946)